MTTRLQKLIGTAAAGMVLAACGTSSTTTTTAAKKAKVHHHATPTTTTSTVAPTTTSSTTTSTTAVSTSDTVNGGQCISSQLTLARNQTSAAAGSIAISFSFTNTAPTSCYLQGYPGLQMLSSSGAAIPTHLTWGSSVSVPAEPVTKVSLNTGQSAYFIIGYATQTGYGNDTCPTSSSVEFTPPNSVNSLSLPVALSPYGGTIQALQCGDITASPVLATLPEGY